MRASGKWSIDETGSIIATCSECGCVIVDEASWCTDEFLEIYRYCPTCGAYMDGGNDESNRQG